jgi:hypothetical protein
MNLSKPAAIAKQFEAAWNAHDMQARVEERWLLLSTMVHDSGLTSASTRLAHDPWCRRSSTPYAAFSYVAFSGRTQRRLNA